MRNLVYAVVLLLFIGWLLGYFVFHYGAAIHVLLITAVVIIVLNTFSPRKSL
jgi:hypothetical protein